MYDFNCPVCDSRSNTEWTRDGDTPCQWYRTCLSCGSRQVVYLDTEFLKDSIITDLKNDRKIQAIKTYRMLTGLGLRDSKDFIDRLMEVISFFD